MTERKKWENPLPEDRQEALRKQFLGLFRLPKVIEVTGLSRATVYRREAAGTFPRHIATGGIAVWKKADVMAWVESLEASDAA